MELFALIPGLLLLGALLAAAATWILRHTADSILQTQLRHLKAAGQAVVIERVDESNLQAVIRCRERTIILDISRHGGEPQRWSVTLEEAVSEPVEATLWLMVRRSTSPTVILGREPHLTGDPVFDAVFVLGGSARLVERIVQDAVLREHLCASGLAQLRLREGRLRLIYSAAHAAPRVTSSAWAHSLAALEILSRPR